MTGSSAHEQVEVNGIRVSYREAGRGRPLVLVHGNFGSGRWFSDQLESPPDGWRLIAPDLPNFGHSDPMPGSITIEKYADYLAAFLDALGVVRPALLGHSLGGAVVQAFAVHRPQGVDRLLLVASAGPDGHKTPADHVAFLESLRFDRSLLEGALAATTPTRRPPYFAGIVDDAQAMAPDAWSGNSRALERFDVATLTGSIEVPVLVLRGALDLPHLISEAVARRTASAYQNSRLELWDDVGHSPQIEAPARFNELLAEFLEEAP